ncbi:hypothetical protein AACH06_17415 [Ideonella sp. DXS29W]|uniref:Uncharacterized protein n=1 Tax=Ideonella lacteola TaxID=2984193 RepID=A0ABU9BRL1_9BURK
MSSSILNRRVIWAAIALSVLSVGQVRAQGVDCTLSADPDIHFDLKIFDQLDDLRDGTLAAPLSRACPAGSPTPDAAYTLSTSEGELRVVRTYKGSQRHAVTTTSSQGVLRIDGFPANVNSVGITAYGSDVNGRYVPRTHLVVTVYAPDGTVMESRTFPGTTRHYSLGATWSVPVGAIELKMLEKQPTADQPVFPTIEAVNLGHDYDMMP